MYLETRSTSSIRCPGVYSSDKENGDERNLHPEYSFHSTQNKI